MSDFDKKAYWKKRGRDKVTSSIKSIDPLYDEIKNISEYAGVSSDDINKSLALISQSFASLLQLFSDELPRTKEGVVDLGAIKTQKKHD